ADNGHCVHCRIPTSGTEPLFSRPTPSQAPSPGATAAEAVHCPRLSGFTLYLEPDMSSANPALRPAACLCLFLSLAAAPFAALALDITVTKTSDSLDGACDDDCSLREAVVLANQTAGAHRIRLAAGTYQLSRPAPQSTAGKVFGED